MKITEVNTALEVLKVMQEKMKEVKLGTSKKTSNQFDKAHEEIELAIKMAEAERDEYIAHLVNKVVHDEKVEVTQKIGQFMYAYAASKLDEVIERGEKGKVEGETEAIRYAYGKNLNTLKFYRDTVIRKIPLADYDYSGGQIVSMAYFERLKKMMQIVNNETRMFELADKAEVKK